MTAIERRTASATAQFSSAIPPLLQRLYAQRGLQCDDDLAQTLRDLLTYQTLPDVEKAVLALTDAMKTGKRIVIVGDFDADGATSVALSLLALKDLQAPSVDYLVPNRFEDGYGLTPDVVRQAQAKGAELIMTVDNGVSAVEGVALSNELGIPVLVTDHHLPGETLPKALAIVNPNLNDCGFPSKALCGVGVAFYLMLALRAHLRTIGWFDEKGIAEPNFAEYLDLVALGTVADVVPLDKNNRILVKQGLDRIRQGRCRPGIRALVEVANRSLSNMASSDLGFSLGPRLNAAGRLDDMSYGVDLLLETDLPQARKRAHELDALNQSRKEIEQGMRLEAIALCERLSLSKDDLPYGLSLYHKDWHQGVIGILASRIKEQFHRPVIAFADAGDGHIKGSCRSIPGLHMRDTLELISTQHPDLILTFGGHAMAAGLTISESDFDRFSALFDLAVRDQLDKDALSELIVTDGELLVTEMNLPTAELLREGGPWGQHFPEPTFDGEFRMLNQRLVGGRHLKMLVESVNGGVVLDAIAFNIDERRWPDLSVLQATLVYRLDVNEFRGQRTVQLMVEHILPQ